jgi:hypothetical protein
MTESTANLIINVITQISVVVLGYWAYKSKIHAQTAATAARTVADDVKETKQTVEVVRQQTNGNLSAMEELLAVKVRELELETAKVARLREALAAARGEALDRRVEDKSIERKRVD